MRVDYYQYLDSGQIIGAGKTEAENFDSDYVWRFNVALGVALPNQRVNVSDPENHFLENKTSIPYLIDTTTIPADGVGISTISNLPVIAGVDLTIIWEDGLTMEVVDGDITFAIDMAGVYILTLKSPIHIDTQIQVTAV